MGKFERTMVYKMHRRRCMWTCEWECKHSCWRPKYQQQPPNEYSRCSFFWTV